MESVPAELWVEHEDLVRWVVWRIIRRYGGEFEELFGEASLLYVQAVNAYCPRKGSLSNWITFNVYHGLQEVKRVSARRLRIAGPFKQLSKDELRIEGSPSFLEQVWGTLSEESQDVLAILFDLDAGMVPGQYKNKSIVRLILRSTLQDKGYTNSQINQCFSEIQEALIST